MVIENALYHIGALLSEDSVLPMETKQQNIRNPPVCLSFRFSLAKILKSHLEVPDTCFRTFLINAL